MTIVSYKEIIFEDGCDIDEAISLIQLERDLGNNAYGIFRGVKISTDNLCVDDIYKEITGHTKEEYESHLEELFKNYRQIKSAHEAKIQKRVEQRIPYWLETGHEIFPEELWEKWDEIVPIRVKDIFHGMELDLVISVQLTLMEDKEHFYEKIKQLPMEKNTLLFQVTCLLIRVFCENGDEIVEYLEK